MINISIVYALISLMFAGLNDFVFKKQAMKDRSCGHYMMVIGIVWLFVFASTTLVSGHGDISKVALKWGLIVGFLSASANYLLIRSFRDLDAGTGATIYRLNLLIAVVIAILLLNERLTIVRFTGIFMASMAVLLLYDKDKNNSNAIRYAFVLAIIASLLRAFMGVGYKLASNELSTLGAAESIPQSNWFLAFQGMMWLVTGILVRPFEKCTLAVSRNVKYGILSGLLICGIVLFFNRSMVDGDASVVIPVSQMSFLVTLGLSAFLLKERLSLRKIAAVLASVAAIIFLAVST